MDKEKITIVMLSGGVDSVASLYRLLTTTKNKIVAHHINFINRERRSEVERMACTRVVEFLKATVRDFEYTESTFEFPYHRHIGWDIITAMYIGGLVSKNYVAETTDVELCIGDTKDDFGAYQWKSPIAQSIALMSALERPTVQRQLLPTIIQPIVDLTKLELINLIPPQLFELTWSCRTPLVEKINDTNYKFSYCGKCGTCVDLNKIQKFSNKTWNITYNE